MGYIFIVRLELRHAGTGHTGMSHGIHSYAYLDEGNSGDMS
jgi:hypothetical protein